MKNKEHLPIFGIGPAYAAISALLTITACILDYFAIIPPCSFPVSSVIMKIFSLIALLFAAYLWINALIVQRIDKRIQENELVTRGAYAWVRNPIYSAIMLIMWAVLLFTGNLLLLLIFPVYPLLMTAMLRPTEEKWLKELYGESYLAYCKQVNRCIPRLPKKKK